MLLQNRLAKENKPMNKWTDALPDWQKSVIYAVTGRFLTACLKFVTDRYFHTNHRFLRIWKYGYSRYRQTRPLRHTGHMTARKHPLVYATRQATRRHHKKDTAAVLPLLRSRATRQQTFPWIQHRLPVRLWPFWFRKSGKNKEAKQEGETNVWKRRIEYE